MKIQMHNNSQSLLAKIVAKQMSAKSLRMQRKKRYRPNVAAVILSPDHPKERKFFIGHRSDIKNAWQFPQGGIDRGEAPIEALFRELNEEIGCSDVEVLGEYPEWISYDFPPKAKGKRYPFDGQSQKYFLVRLKHGAKIDLSAYTIPEFREYRFVEYDELLKKVSYFKRHVYKKVIDYFIEKGLI